MTYAAGDKYTSGSLSYTELSDGTLEVSGLINPRHIDVIIPEKVDGKKVTSNGVKVFYDRRILTTVTISDGVTSNRNQSIAERVFRYRRRCAQHRCVIAAL